METKWYAKMKYFLAASFVLIIESCLSYESDGFTCNYPNITHGYWIRTEYGQSNKGAVVGDKISISCETGYRLNFGGYNAKMECLEDGTWSDTEQYDSIVVCERSESCLVPVINNGKVAMKDGGYMRGEVAPVECEEGYKLRPPEYTHILCELGGSWYPGKEGMPTCWAKECTLTSSTLTNGYIIAALHGMNIDLTYWKENVPSGTTLQFFCSDRYRISGDELATCRNGTWTALFPKCEALHPSPDFSCLPPSIQPFSSCQDQYGGKTDEGRYRYRSGIRCKCKAGYIDNRSGRMDTWEYRSCMNNSWTGSVLQCVPVARGCQKPPQIEHGSYTFVGEDYFNKGGLIPNGTNIRYTCDDGYQVPKQSFSDTHKCVGSVWSGSLPLCEKRSFCDAPLEIQYGNYRYGEDVRSPNAIGTTIIYTCSTGYKALNGEEETVLTCEESGYWSDYPPKCLSVDSYCPEPEALDNGAFSCNPANCNLFKQGTTIEFFCKNDYILKPDHNQQPYICQADGTWSFGDEELYCDKAPGLLAESESSRQSKTIMVVVGTSLSVFALLTIVLILFLFHKHYKRPVRRCRGRAMQSFCSPPAPPAYSEVPPEGGLENAVVSDADSTALISFPDGTQATLPSYDEVVRGKYPVRLHRVSGSSTSRAGRSGNDFRALPPITQQMRQTVNGARERELSPDHRDGLSINSNQRADGLSVTFGSIETMNVSDNTSTTVTLGTYDSGASNPSLSQRATTGSMNSDPSLTNDDAPLLDPQYDTLSHRSQTASPPIPEVDEETHA